MKIWLFDIDGTLITSGGAGQEATFAALAEAFGVTVSRSGIHFAGRTDRAIAADVFQAHNIPNTPENWQTFQRVYLQQLGERLHDCVGEVLRGVTELMDWLLRDPENHLGLLTGNIRQGAEQKLRHYRLWHHFQFGGFGDMHESRDDVARQALDAARNWVPHQFSPADVWVVGDTVNDIRCARSIGAHVIAVASGGTPAEQLGAAQPDLLLHDLSLSPELLVLLNSTACVESSESRRRPA
jgi:phosphoglycolate phosphatase-like HAD superfamily hydrolase